ncbi:MAG: sel1 repeat family protein [Rhodospirillales bacterium]|nr:sel1 repeat family protein [Rhodospirillales bacterium]
MAEAEIKAKNYGPAYLRLLPLGQKGDPRAQLLLGRMSDNGWGPIALDPREAARWYRMAAENKNAEAQFTLANAYAFGRGVPQDTKEAFTWLRRAANNNHIPAMLGLASLYDGGRGVAKNPAAATQWIRRAADRGNLWAIYHYGERLENGKGIQANPDEAMTWFRRAAESGYADAIHRVSQFWLNSEGGAPTTEQDISTYMMLTLSMERGNDALKKQAAEERAILANRMTPDDIATATARAKAWKPENTQGKSTGTSGAPDVAAGGK